MKQVRKNVLDYFGSNLVLLIYAIIRYLVIPDVGEAEIFSYIIGLAFLVYGICYGIKLIFQIIFKSSNHGILSNIMTFIILEILLFIFTESCLIFSLFSRINRDIFFVYHTCPLILAAMNFLFNKIKMSKRKVEKLILM